MIIVSQNKKRIYNFDNIKLIEVLGNDIFIIDDILADEGPFLGTYESEQRAEEILMDIAHWYEIEAKIYRMPEE